MFPHTLYYITISLSLSLSTFLFFLSFKSSPKSVFPKNLPLCKLCFPYFSETSRRLLHLLFFLERYPLFPQHTHITVSRTQEKETTAPPTAPRPFRLIPTPSNRDQRSEHLRQQPKHKCAWTISIAGRADTTNGWVAKNVSSPVCTIVSPPSLPPPPQTRNFQHKNPKNRPRPPSARPGGSGLRMPDMSPGGPLGAGVLPSHLRTRRAELRSDRRAATATRRFPNACPPPPTGGGRLAGTGSHPFSDQTADQSRDQASGKHPGRNANTCRRRWVCVVIGPEPGDGVPRGIRPWPGVAA